MKEIQREIQKTTTLFELNKRPGQIVREVHFTKEPITVTANGKPVVQICPVQKTENGQKKSA